MNQLRRNALCLAVALPIVSLADGWTSLGIIGAFIGGVLIALAALLWLAPVRSMTGIRRPDGVGDRVWKATEQASVPSILIHYSNDRAGARTAGQDSRELAILGYRPVSQATTGSHTNLGRTALNAATALGMARVIGVGIFSRSRSRGELLVTYQKRRPAVD